MDKRISSITLGENNTIKEAMERINETGLRIVLITDESKKLLGVVADGDIRRALLSGKNFQTLLQEIMATNPIKAVEGVPAMELLEIMIKNNIQEIPITDKNGVLSDIVLLSEIKRVPLSSPDITSKDIEAINQVLSTSFLSIGPKVKEFEKKIADYIGVKYAVAVNSGTSGLHLCVRSLDIKDGDEVITAPFSFIASANCMLFERAKPVFVDIDEKTLCLDVDKIEEKITERTKAIMPVHIFGHSCEMDKIMELAKKYDLAVIEDACEAIGGEYKGRKVGSFGDASVFAFYPNKQITTAEGGMIVTNDENIARLCQSMRNQGRDDNNEWLSHMRLGYNYRMSELSAALGVAQIERIDEILGKRQKIAEYYNERLKGIDGIEIPYASLDIKMSWFVYVIKLDNERFSRKDRNQIMEELKKRGIACKAYFPPIHLEPFYVKMFNYQKGSFPVTERVSDSTITLPFYNNLPKKEIDYVCDSLDDIIKNFAMN